MTPVVLNEVKDLRGANEGGVRPLGPSLRSGRQGDRRARLGEAGRLDCLGRDCASRSLSASVFTAIENSQCCHDLAVPVG